MDFQEVKDDLKELKADVHEIKVNVAKNTVSLTEHMRRTSLNEKRVEALEKWALGLLASLVVALLIKGLG